MNDDILNPPLAPLRDLVSARTLNLLTRNGLSSVRDVQQAHDLGTLRDVRGLGPVAVWEIKLALGNLPPDATELPAGTSSAPLAENASALSGRELIILLAMAEAGLDHLDSRVSVNEAMTALGHLRQLAGEDEVGDMYPAEPAWDSPVNQQKRQEWNATHDTEGRPASVVTSRPEPEPEDDSFEGYVIEPKTGWGQF